MTEYHRGPYRGPISGGLPGIAVAAFALILTGWFVSVILPFWVAVGVVVAAVAFFLFLRFGRG